MGFVGFLLTEEGALKLAPLTKSHIGEFVAVMIDGRVRSTPKIIGEITGGRAFIAGNMNEDQARLNREWDHGEVIRAFKGQQPALRVATNILAQFPALRHRDNQEEICFSE